MYGLMKAHVCSQHAEAAQQRRLHYCGTCKTMGRLYGQKARFLLNHDAVFLAELLTALAQQAQSVQAQPVAEWGRAYQSYNCLTLPGSEAEMPLPLQIASAVTLMMTEFKAADQITDGASRKWKTVRKLFSSEFAAAVQRMQAWGFPIQEIWEWGSQQEERESRARNQSGQETALAILDGVAEPTAQVTGCIFEQSARTVGGDLPMQQGMRALGVAFGALVYVLDAYEDYAKDGRRGDFNALQAAFQMEDDRLPDCYQSAAVAHLRELQNRVVTALKALPLPSEQAALFVARLSTNMDRRLGETEESTTCATRLHRSLPAARWKPALTLAQTLAKKHRRQQFYSLSARLMLPGGFLTALTVGLVFPRQALGATSFQECRDIACNLIFLSAAMRELTTVPMRLIPRFAVAAGPAQGMFSLENVSSASASDPSSANNSVGSRRSSSSTKVRKVRRPNRCCDGCCDCCDGIECCGDGCCCACECCECASVCG